MKFNECEESDPGVSEMRSLNHLGSRHWVYEAAAYMTGEMPLGQRNVDPTGLVPGEQGLCEK